MIESHFGKGNEVLIHRRTRMEMQCFVKAASHQGHAVTPFTRSMETSKSAETEGTSAATGNGTSDAVIPNSARFLERAV